MRVGVDEAGKGPVLGSLFAAAVVAKPSELPEGVKDSKQVTPTQREELAASIQEKSAVTAVVEIPVERIDDPETDMNQLTVAAHAKALESCDSQEYSIYLDACDTNAQRFADRVGNQLDCSPELIAEHGADETYPIVSAASIIAKVSRDKHISELARDYGNIGSGYPSDPATRDFLKEYISTNGTLPKCARQSWQTCTDLLGEFDQTALSEF